MSLKIFAVTFSVADQLGSSERWPFVRLPFIHRTSDHKISRAFKHF